MNTRPLETRDADHIQLSSRDSLRVVELLTNPPEPNPKLLAAARALHANNIVWIAD